MTVLTTVDVIDGTTIDAADVNANMAAVRTVINGGIDNGNIHAAAAIAISKLAGYPGDVTKILYGDGTWAAAPAGGGGGGVTPPFPASYIVGYPADPTKFLRGDGAWASVTVSPGAIGGFPSNGQLSLRGDGTWGTAYTAASFIAGYPSDPTKVLHGDGTWSAPSSSAAAPSYGTTLPVSPVDGQEVILVDSVAAPTYQWRFRYNAGSSSAQKWEFIGGPPMTANQEAVGTFTSNGSYIDPSSVCALTVPKAGVYVVDFGVANSNNTGDQQMNYAPKIGAAAPTDANSLTFKPSNTGYTTHGMRRLNGVLCAAGDVLKIQVKPTGNGQCKQQWISITPVRVS